MLINHQSEFQSAMQDLEYLGYDVLTIIPNSPYNLKDIILTLCSEYQSVAFEEGHAEGHAAGYDVGHEEGSEGCYEVGYEVGREEGYENGYESSYEVAYDDGFEAGDDHGYNIGWDAGYKDGQDELRAELEYVGNTDEEDGVRYL